MNPLKSMLRWFRPTKKKCLTIAGISLLLFLTLWYALPFAFPYSPQALTGEKSSLIILDKNGHILHHKSRDDFFRLQRITLDEIPADLIQATLAAEDKRFYSHGGVDLLATARAFKDGIAAGRMVSGASTITQQTVKLSSPPEHKVNRTIKNKIIEALTARHLEMSSDKTTILTSYFNHLDYGNHMLGPKQAALHYFGTPLHQLSLAQCALLAGIPQSPTRHNPRTNPDSALNRRNWILDRMQLVHHTDSERIARAKAEPLHLKPPRYLTNAPQIAELILKQQIQAKEIRTTIDPDLQNFCRSTLASELEKLTAKNVQNGAIVIINNHTREIITLVGTHNFNSLNSGQINAATTPRSPGSVLKPLVYILAFDELRLTPASIIPDIKTVYGGERGPEEFVNYERLHHGPVTIYHALGNSLNIPIIRITNQMGGPKKLLTLYHQLGFSYLTKPASSYGLGLAIGSGEVTLLDATNAFSTIANQGKHTQAKLIPNLTEATATQVFSAQSAKLVTSIISDNSARAASFGTHSNLRLPFPCAVKTGTSSDFRDNWCIGFTKNYTVGVWIGNLDNSPMKGISGVTGAGPLFKATMLRLHKTRPPSWFPNNQLQAVAIDPKTGKRLPATHPRYPLAIHTYAPEKQLPTTAEASDYAPDGSVYLNNIYKNWLSKHPNKSYTLSPEQQINFQLRIIAPTHQNTYLLDPDLPNQGKFLTLQSSSPNQTIWTSPTLKIINRNNKATAVLSKGTHTLTVTDKHTKQSETIEFSVKSL